MPARAAAVQLRSPRIRPFLSGPRQHKLIGTPAKSICGCGRYQRERTYISSFACQATVRSKLRASSSLSSSPASRQASKSSANPQCSHAGKLTGSLGAPIPSQTHGHRRWSERDAPGEKRRSAILAASHPFIKRRTLFFGGAVCALVKSPWWLPHQRGACAMLWAGIMTKHVPAGCGPAKSFDRVGGKRETRSASDFGLRVREANVTRCISTPWPAWIDRKGGKGCLWTQLPGRWSCWASDGSRS